jgi:hypothetical protein
VWSSLSCFVDMMFRRCVSMLSISINVVDVRTVTAQFDICLVELLGLYLWRLTS